MPDCNQDSSSLRIVVARCVAFTSTSSVRWFISVYRFSSRFSHGFFWDFLKNIFSNVHVCSSKVRLLEILSGVRFLLVGSTMSFPSDESCSVLGFGPRFPVVGLCWTPLPNFMSTDILIHRDYLPSENHWFRRTPLSMSIPVVGVCCIKRLVSLTMLSFALQPSK